MLITGSSQVQILSGNKPKLLKYFKNLQKALLFLSARIVGAQHVSMPISRWGGSYGGC